MKKARMMVLRCSWAFRGSSWVAANSLALSV
jgi:hypothetical protein